MRRYCFAPGGIEWSRGGMRVRAMRGGRRQMLGMLLVLAGVLLVFLCMPPEIFVIALGVVLAAAGLLLIR